MPSSSAVQVSVPISAFASGYTNSAFIAEQLCPVIPVDFPKGTYFSKSKVDVATAYDDLGGQESEASTIDYATTQTNFVCLDRMLQAFIPWKVIRAAQDPLKPREAYAANVMQRLLLKQEIRVATLLQTTGNFASSNTSAAAAKWTDEVLGAPVKDIQTMIAAISPGDPGTTKLVMGLGLEAWQALARHPQVLGLRPGGGLSGGVASTKEVAGYLGLDDIVVSDVVKNTAARGATATYVRCWDTTKAVVVRVPTKVPDFNENLSLFSCMFRYRAPDQMPFVAIEWDEPKRGPGTGSIGVKITHSTIENVIQNDMGYCLTTVT